MPSAFPSRALPTLLTRRFVIGYINQEFRLTFLWLSAGGGISAVVTPSSLTLTLALNLSLSLSLSLCLSLSVSLTNLT